MTGNWRRVSLILFLIVMLVILPAVVLAQDEPQEEEDAVCNPVALRLADEMGVDCQDLLDLQAQGFGFGEIMKAWHLSLSLEGFEGDWRALLEQKQEEGLGWGQMKMAYRLAGEGGDPQALLELKQSGVGWGQIKKAQSLSQAGLLDFDEALQMMQEGQGWGEISAQLGLPPGPPPWAGGGKDKSNQGPPAWANNDKDKGEQGPPSWANNDKDKNQDD